LPQSPEGYAWIRTGGPNGGIGYDIRIHPKDKNVMFVTDNPVELIKVMTAKNMDSKEQRYSC